MQKYYFYEQGTRRFIATRDGFVFGRNEGDQCYPRDALMSRRHCRISISGDSVFVEDLGSTNHTKVNSQVIQAGSRRRLQLNDVVEFGAQRVILTNQTKHAPGNLADAGGAQGKFKGLRTESGSLTSQISRIITKQTQVLLNFDDFMKLGIKEFFRPWTWDFSMLLVLAGMLGAGGYAGFASASAGVFEAGVPHGPGALGAKLGMTAGIPAAGALFLHYIVMRRLGRKRPFARLGLVPASFTAFLLVAVTFSYFGGLLGDVQENSTVHFCVNHFTTHGCRPYAHRELAGFARLPRELQNTIVSRLIGD